MYEYIIGLEVHCELMTHTKMFSPSPVSFGKEPNTMVNEIDLGMPGIMPCLNKKGVEYALRVCHALHMDIDELVVFDRKNYYYSDLTKGFQITQQEHPIGKNGYLDINVDGKIKRISIERLHMEEDTAKQLHYSDYSLIDYNRSGIPLIEIVSEPVINSGKEAMLYLEKLRQIFLYTEVSDARLEEGSMRCDVNVSVRKKGTDILGTKCEIKNLNSMSNVAKAIDYEAKRHIQLIEEGKEVLQETRRYDEASKQTVLMRSKGDAVDYKYYREPNILPIRLDHQWVENIKQSLPMMMDERYELYTETYHLPSNEARTLVEHKDLSDFFNECLEYCSDDQILSHYMVGDVQAYLNKHNLSIKESMLKPSDLGKLIDLIHNKEISSAQGKKVFNIMMEEGKDPLKIIEENHMRLIRDEDELKVIINQILDDHPKSIEDYKRGKTKVIGYLVGQLMKETHGQSDPEIGRKLIGEILDER